MTTGLMMKDLLEGNFIFTYRKICDRWSVGVVTGFRSQSEFFIF